MPRAASSGTPPASSARRQSTAAASAKASSCASEPPALWMMRPSATANGPRKPCSASARTLPAKTFDNSFHGIGLAPLAAKPPIGLMLARRSTEAGESLRAFTSAANMLHGVARRRAQVEIDGDAHRARRCRERAPNVSGDRVKPVAVGVERAGEYQRQSGRAVFQILERLRVGGGRDRDDRPAASPSRARRRAGRRPAWRRPRAHTAARSAGRHRSGSPAACRSRRP